MILGSWSFRGYFAFTTVQPVGRRLLTSCRDYDDAFLGPRYRFPAVFQSWLRRSS